MNAGRPSGRPAVISGGVLSAALSVPFKWNKMGRPVPFSVKYDIIDEK